MKALVAIIVGLLTLTIFAYPIDAKSPKAPGKRVKSGAFYEFVMPYYTQTLPALIEARDAEKLYNTVPIDKARWRMKADDGVEYDYKQRITMAKESFTANTANKWDVSIKVKKVTMTDATHGAVEWVMTNDWKNPYSGKEGRVTRRSVSHWEQIDGQWRVVLTEQGSLSNW